MNRQNIWMITNMKNEKCGAATSMYSNNITGWKGKMTVFGQDHHIFVMSEIHKISDTNNVCGM